MKKLSILLFFALFVSCQKDSIVSPITAPVIATPVVNEQTSLDALITPLKNSPLALENQDLKIFDSLKTAPIIGLGEATHGTKEFFEMKHRLFKYFVENFKHKIFAFEMDYGESLIFDEYVQTGKGDLVQLMKTRMYFWVWNTVEVKNLLEWMKTYNQTKPESERVHIYGIDCQTFSYNVPELLRRINLVAPALNNELKKLLGTIPGDTIIYNGELHDKIVQAVQLISDNKNLIISKSSLKEYSIIEHLADVILQTDVYLTELKRNPLSTLRDKYMANNTIWLKEQSSFPMSVWAHNLHIANEGINMGSILSSKYQENYQKIGFSFATGTVTARNFTSKKIVYSTFPVSVRTDYVNQLFYQANSPNFTVKMADMFNNELLKNYFSKEPFFQIGATFYDQFDSRSFTTLKAFNFNYLIHINRSTHSECYCVNP